MRLAVLMPVFNEALLAPVAVQRLLDQPPPPGFARRLYVVDDGSTDGTQSYIQALGAAPEARDAVRALLHPRNRGKGAAVRTALAAALHDPEPPDALLIHDADLEYDPADHAALVAPIAQGRADAVMGTRFAARPHRPLYTLGYRANQLLTALSNATTGLRLSDIECCLKAFSRETAQGLRLREERFGIEPEIVAKVARLRLTDPSRPGHTRAARVLEAPVSYRGRTYAQGKKIGARDGAAAVAAIVRYGWLSR